MRTFPLPIGILAFLSFIPVIANGQAQLLKETALGQEVLRQIGQKDGFLGEPAVMAYLERLADRIAVAAGGRPLEVHVTLSPYASAFLLPGQRLVISAGLLAHIGSEMELAGLLAHELAHDADAPIFWGGCVLATGKVLLGGENARARELDATRKATRYLRAAGYDPAGVFDVFAKLVDVYPVSVRVISPVDLERLRASELDEDVPAGGYRVQSSEFMETHARVEASLEGGVRRRPSLIR